MIHLGNFLTGIISYVIRSMLANAYLNSKRTTGKQHLVARRQIVTLYSSVLFFFQMDSRIFSTGNDKGV